MLIQFHWNVFSKAIDWYQVEFSVIKSSPLNEALGLPIELSYVVKVPYDEQFFFLVIKIFKKVLWH